MSKFIVLVLLPLVKLVVIPQGGGFANAPNPNSDFPVSSPDEHHAALHQPFASEMNHTSQKQKNFCENIPKQGGASLRRPILPL